MPSGEEHAIRERQERAKCKTEASGETILSYYAIDKAKKKEQDSKHQGSLSLCQFHQKNPKFMAKTQVRITISKENAVL